MSKDTYLFSPEALAVTKLARFGAGHLETLAMLEINPLIVGRQGVTGVDVLAEPHS